MITTNAPRLGKSQRAVMAWLKRRSKGATAAEVGKALWEKTSSQHGSGRLLTDEGQLGRQWAARVLSSLLERGIVSRSRADDDSPIVWKLEQ